MKLFSEIILNKIKAKALDPFAIDFKIYESTAVFVVEFKLL